MTDGSLLLVALVVLLWVLGLAAAIAIFLGFVAGGLVLAFTAFVASLWDSVPLLVILMFILFPPTLIVYLVGLAMIKLGILQR